MTTDTTAPPIVLEVVAILIADGWHRTWAACTNSVADEYGNTATLHTDDQTMTVTFEYALGGIVESLNLDPSHGVNRIARVIATLADPPEFDK